MINPETNADYAARLLSQHKSRLGSWDAAAGAYHSGTAVHADRYIARFRALRDRASPPAQTQLATHAPDPLRRENTYTLLQPAGEQRMGSLVPMDSDQAARPLIQFGAITR